MVAGGHCCRSGECLRKVNLRLCRRAKSGGCLAGIVLSPSLARRRGISSHAVSRFRRCGRVVSYTQQSSRAAALGASP